MVIITILGLGSHSANKIQRGNHEKSWH